MTRWLAIFLLLLAGCSKDTTTTYSANDIRPTTAAVTRPAANVGTSDLFQMSAAQVSFGRSWGEADYQQLVLLQDGGFSYTHSSCTGLLTAAIGKWKLVGDRLLLEPQGDAAKSNSVPRILHLRMLGGPSTVVLVEDDDLATVERDGATASTCYQSFPHLDESP